MSTQPFPLSPPAAPGERPGLLGRLRRLVRPAPLDLAGLLPWQQVEADEQNGPGAWRATGDRPQFLVRGALPANAG